MALRIDHSNTSIKAVASRENMNALDQHRTVALLDQRRNGLFETLADLLRRLVEADLLFRSRSAS